MRTKQYAPVNAPFSGLYSSPLFVKAIKEAAVLCLLCFLLLVNSQTGRAKYRTLYGAGVCFCVFERGVSVAPRSGGRALVVLTAACIRSYYYGYWYCYDKQYHQGGVEAYTYASNDTHTP